MRLLTISEVSELLKVRPSRAYQLVRDGVIPGVRVGRQVRVAEESLATPSPHGMEAEYVAPSSPTLYWSAWWES